MPGKRFELNHQVVLDHLTQLRKARTHKTFPGYLCLRAKAVVSGWDSRLKPDFRAFFDRYFKLGDAPPSYPYVVPFGVKDDLNALWFNKNVAGSYAPSSLRPAAPMRRVADIFSSGKTHEFQLKDEHAKLCLEYLLSNSRISALSLAVFLFRDFGFYGDDAEDMPTAEDVLIEFRRVFGFRQEFAEEGSDFETLFDVHDDLPELKFDEVVE